MSFEGIRNQLKTKLGTISSIQEVHDFPTEEFGGFPAVVVKSTRLDADFETTVENERIYVFTLFVFYEIESKKMDKARSIVEGVVDDIVEALDKDQQLSGITLPDNETMVICFPTMTEMADDEKYVVAELEINIKISFNIET